MEQCIHPGIAEIKRAPIWNLEACDIWKQLGKEKVKESLAKPTVIPGDSACPKAVLFEQ